MREAITRRERERETAERMKSIVDANDDAVAVSRAKKWIARRRDQIKRINLNSKRAYFADAGKWPMHRIRAANAKNGVGAHHA